jgi:hypothetical protein
LPRPNEAWREGDEKKGKRETILLAKFGANDSICLRHRERERERERAKRE